MVLGCLVRHWLAMAPVGSASVPEHFYKAPSKSSQMLLEIAVFLLPNLLSKVPWFSSLLVLAGIPAVSRSHRPFTLGFRVAFDPFRPLCELSVCSSFCGLYVDAC